jgi:SRSO17 transposase
MSPTAIAGFVLEAWILAGAPARSISWRSAAPSCRAGSAAVAALRVRVADGPTQRIGDLGNQHMPGEEVWLIGERRANATGTSLRALAAAIKARWICEQAHQQLKEELGLDHFEGRSWAGLHRHALMSMIAYAFLQTQRLAAAKGKKKHRRTAA